MTWNVATKAPNRAAAQVALTMELAKSMLAQKPHARDFDLVHKAISSAIDVCEECTLPNHVIAINASGHVDYDGWNNPVPTITGVTVRIEVRRVAEVIVAPADPIPVSFYERHGVVRAVQWNRHGDHPHVGPGVRESGGKLHINVALPYARRHVEPSDWIITEGSGACTVVTDAEFRHNYKGL